MSDARAGTHERTYLKVFGILVAFTIATYFLAEEAFKNNKLLTVLFVMAIAMIKASFVMRFFMHLKFEGRWKYVMLVPTCLLAIVLVAALLPDIGRLGAWRL